MIDMREILFRGISKSTGQHVFGDVYHNDRRVAISWYDENGEYQEEEILAETVEQFTGILDREGKKIFEGDTVGRQENGVAKDYAVYFYNGKFIISECRFLDAPDKIGCHFYDDLDGDCWILATDHCWS